MAVPLLEAKSIAKSYPGVRALKNSSFDLLEGEVHALIGENGAGKTTLIKVITGAIQPDSGSLSVCGRTVEQNDPSIARSLGIAAIYQQPSLFPHLSVAENIAVALEGGEVWRRVNWKARNRRARELMERAGASIEPERLVSTLSMPEQQLVEIAKAIGADAKILIMDEPTASLTDREVDSLFKTIGVFRNHGAGIIYISHRLEEITTIADRITVMRDGETIATRRREEVDKPTLISMMVGREIDTVYPKHESAPGDVALELRHVSNRATGLKDISLSVRCGEIVGLAGLGCSARTPLAQTKYRVKLPHHGRKPLSRAPGNLSSPPTPI